MEYGKVLAPPAYGASSGVDDWTRVLSDWKQVPYVADNAFGLQ